MQCKQRTGGKVQILIRAVALCSLVVSALCFFTPAAVPAAYADPGGTLTVRVGYTGYPYVEQKTYTSADLRALGTSTQYYSWIDGKPAPVMMAAEGVPLKAIMADAGIDTGAAQRYYFRASDGHEAIAEFTTALLLDTPRYWFPNLSKTWDNLADYGNGAPGVGAEEDKKLTETMIALKEYHERYIEEPRDDLMRDANGFRLVYGAAFLNDPNAGFHDSVHSITHIDVQLVGSPPEEKGENDDDDLISSDVSNETTGSGSDTEDGSGKGTGQGDGSGAGTGTGSGDGTGSGAGVGKGDGIASGGGDSQGKGAGGKGIISGSGKAQGDGKGKDKADGSGNKAGRDKDSEGAVDIKTDAEAEIATGAALGDVQEIVLSDGTVTTGREIGGFNVLMELSYAGGGGGGISDGDDPWAEYDIAKDSAPLKLPEERRAAGVVFGVTGLSFTFGAGKQSEILNRLSKLRKRKSG
ncbi:MAG: hypothetical protein LBN35_00665 [Clostridiales Family XIII bacterium]|jgi:hypothetical protein|nr:hypothetical protein [Clostridiales Family XIII bacterium]